MARRLRPRILKRILNAILSVFPDHLWRAGWVAWKVNVNAADSSQPVAGGARRGDARHVSRVSVTIRSLRETTSGLVLDLSRNGARLFMDSALDCTGDVLLHWLGHDVSARVMWSRQYECGVQFHRPLGDEALAQLNAALAPVTAGPAPPPAAVVVQPAVGAKPREAASLASMSMARRRDR